VTPGKRYRKAVREQAQAANQGVFFVTEGGGATKVDVVGRNKPGELMFMVPAGLAADDYTLEVRATIHDSEDVRTHPRPTRLKSLNRKSTTNCPRVLGQCRWMKHRWDGRWRRGGERTVVQVIEVR
jgi:hypothetical protein